MESLKFSTICIGLRRWARDMGDAVTQILVLEMAVFLQMDSSGKVGRDCTHVGSITYTMCCAKANGIGCCQTLIKEDRGVQWPGLLLPKVDHMF